MRTLYNLPGRAIDDKQIQVRIKMENRLWFDGIFVS